MRIKGLSAIEKQTNKQKKIYQLIFSCYLSESRREASMGGRIYARNLQAGTGQVDISTLAELSAQGKREPKGQKEVELAQEESAYRKEARRL